MTNGSEKNSAFEKRIKKHVIGKPHRFMAVAPLGFEETLVKELKYIGVECFAENSGCGRAAPSCHSEAVAPSCHSEERSDEESSNTAGIKVAGDGKVEFTAKITEAWKAVAYSRIANRILMEIGSFKAENFGQLEKGAAGVPWELYLPVCHSERSVAESSCHSERSVAKSKNLDIHVTCKHSRLYHSDAVAERIQKIIASKFSKDPIASARLQDDCRKMPTKGNVTLEGGTTDRVQTQHLYVNLQDDRCTLWLDLAGEELYKRGHERFVAEAPLKETIAAAMIFEAVRLQAIHQSSSVRQTPSCDNHQLSIINHQLNIVDPMAGSGTFSLEAVYIANGLFPGKCRDFALKHQPAFKEGTWNFILKGAKTAADSTTCHSEAAAPLRHSEERSDEESTTNLLSIITSDISERPISIIKHNIEVSPLAEIAKKNPNAVTINPKLKDFFTYTIDDICAIQPPANQSSIPPEYQSSIINHQSSIPPANKSSIINHQSSIILLNPPYGKRLAFDAPALYKKIGQKLDQLSREAQARNNNSQSCDIALTVAILAPKDDTRGGAHYTCTENLLKACPALNPSNNPEAKLIETSHGGFSLNAIFAKI